VKGGTSLGSFSKGVVILRKGLCQGKRGKIREDSYFKLLISRNSTGWELKKTPFSGGGGLGLKISWRRLKELSKRVGWAEGKPSSEPYSLKSTTQIERRKGYTLWGRGSVLEVIECITLKMPIKKNRSVEGKTTWWRFNYYLRRWGG